MPVVTESIAIDATPDTVFAAIADVEGLPETQPEVVAVEFLTEGGFTGVGTRFRETRDLGGGRTLDTEIEVVDYDPEARRLRMVADTHGTVWDTRMSVDPAGAGSRLTFSMDARGSTVLKRVMNVLMKPMFRRGIRAHLRAVKARLEPAPSEG